MACGHPYCKDCLVFWERRTGKNMNSDLPCPVCKVTAQQVEQRASQLEGSSGSSGSAVAQLPAGMKANVCAADENLALIYIYIYICYAIPSNKHQRGALVGRL